MDFSPLFSRDSFLLEADDDQQSAGDNAGGETQAPTEGEGGGDQTADTGNNDNAGGGDDLDINIDDSSMTDDGGGDTGGDTGSSGGSSTGEGDPNASVDTEAKQKDRELFDTLTPQEQKLKTVELKRLYMDLYDRCEQIADKFDVLGVEYEDLSPAISSAISSLFTLKNMISTHLLYLFDAKTYYQNDIEYNQFLLALNKIKLITDDMVSAHKEEIDATKSCTPLNDKDIERENRT